MHELTWRHLANEPPQSKIKNFINFVRVVHLINVKNHITVTLSFEWNLNTRFVVDCCVFISEYTVTVFHGIFRSKIGGFASTWAVAR